MISVYMEYIFPSTSFVLLALECIVISLKKICSDNLCLLTGVITPFTFIIIIDVFGFRNITFLFSVCPLCFLLLFFPFPHSFGLFGYCFVLHLNLSFYHFTISVYSFLSGYSRNDYIYMASIYSLSIQVYTKFFSHST